MRNICFGILFFSFSLLCAQSNNSLAAAKEFIRVGNFDNALKQLDALTQKTPNDQEAWLWKAIAYTRINQNDKAENTLNQGFELSNKNVAIYYRFANWCLNQERNALAETYFNKILSINPKSAEGLIGNASLLNLKKEYEKSENILQNVNERDIVDSLSLDKFPFLQAEALYGVGKKENAWEKMNRFLASHIAPYHFGARNMAVSWYMEEGKKEKALNLLTEMLSYANTPEMQGQILLKRATCYAQLNKNILACVDLAEAEAVGVDTSLLVLRHKINCKAEDNVNLSNAKSLTYEVKMDLETPKQSLEVSLEEFVPNKKAEYSWRMGKNHKGHTLFVSEELFTMPKNVSYLELQNEIGEGKLSCWVGANDYQFLPMGKLSISASLGQDMAIFEYGGTRQLLVKEKGVDKLINCHYAKSEAWGEIWILANESNPLIIKRVQGNYLVRLSSID